MRSGLSVGTWVARVLAVAGQVGRVSGRWIRAARREIDLAFRDGSALRARPDRIELTCVGANGAVRDAHAFTAAWCTATDHTWVPTDPLQLDHRPAPGDWLSAQPRARARLNRRRLAGRAILALADDLDGADTLRDLFGTATGLAAGALPVVSLETPSDLTPTLVLGPKSDATLATEPDRWLPALERRLAETPDMACILSGGSIVSLRRVIDAVGNARPLAAVKEPVRKTQDDGPSYS